MREIALSRGQVAIVDDEAFEPLSCHRWYAIPCRNGGYYAERTERVGGSNHMVIMHAVVAETPRGLETHHISGDTLDNRRANLLIVTRQEHAIIHGKTTDHEQMRRTKQGQKVVGGSSRYVGVHLHTGTGKFRARISVKGKRVNIGGFATDSAAAQAYNQAALHYYGPSARLNVIEAA